ncbi:hypothetical protein A5725_18780 [Mycobacterium kubicae]|uniref:alpha-D-ribose 1-methylphosphonate 5-triphosphate diphosphatase n=1 Tax=Mycobacterium kubicae TaxID=120959 RepID=UPI0007FC2A84|nr:alpha-D-ribose 1-methylphosphonate 5-triphosphate diphosphatase [Mycobacterium kubicae]OBF19179.1 hypothetical protein A5725_18780 [Mycobacterium kubicae]
MISLRGARVVTAAADTGDADVPRWVTIDDGRISAIGTEPPSAALRYDLGPLQLWPAFTDLHADTLPRFESPRSGITIPLPEALQDFATDSVAHGVVRPYLCVSVGEGPEPIDGYCRAQAVLETLDRIGDALAVPVRVHLRVDVGDPQSVDRTAQLLSWHGAVIGLLSVMDHTPGQGQFRTEGAWRRAMGARLRLDDEELDRWRQSLHEHASGVVARRRQVARLAAAHHTVLAVHDPDSPSAVGEAAAMGARLCEFPLTLKTAAAARDWGIAVVMGAPNAWRGASHLGNLSARAAIAAGVVDVLTSDYHTGSLARAAVAIAAAEVGPIAAAVHMLSTNPCRAIGSPLTGALMPGQSADLVAVRTEPIVNVVATWSSGKQVSGPSLG